jgi:hypothetical protein
MLGILLFKYLFEIKKLMGEVEINASSLSFCYVVIFNKWDKQNKRHIYLGMIHVDKP